MDIPVIVQILAIGTPLAQYANVRTTVSQIWTIRLYYCHVGDLSVEFVHNYIASQNLSCL